MNILIEHYLFELMTAIKFYLFFFYIFMCFFSFIVFCILFCKCVSLSHFARIEYDFVVRFRHENYEQLLKDPLFVFIFLIEKAHRDNVLHSHQMREKCALHTNYACFFFLIFLLFKYETNRFILLYK